MELSLSAPGNHGYVKNASAWGQQQGQLSRDELIKRYSQGAAGCIYSHEAHEAFRAKMKARSGIADVEDAAHQFGYADSYAGQLVLPFIEVAEIFAGCFPGPAQERGDCVSHDMRTGGVFTMAAEIARGTPDEVSGKIEEAPKLSAEGIANLVFSPEYLWWQRGYNGDGWYIEAAIEAGIENGFLLCQPYPDQGIDLTHYSYANTAKYGRTAPPESILSVGRFHPITSSADVTSPEALRDAMGNGFGIVSDGGEGFSSSRDEYGFSKRSGGWSHSFPLFGFDDRDIIKKIFGEPLVLDGNNWAAWNSGPRDIYQSANLVPPEKKALWIKLGLVNPKTGNIMIPEGCWWARWSDNKNRNIKALAGFRGWAKKPINLSVAGII